MQGTARAVPGGVREVRRGNGQACTAPTRLRLQEAEQIFRSGNHVIRRTRLLIYLIEFYFNLSMESNSFGLGQGL